MLRVGLTGGIGSGKSEVSRRLAARGAKIIDADLAARDVVQPGTPGLGEIVAVFGLGVLRPDGSLDREQLGRLVFADPGLRAKLNAIVHPLVHERMRQLERQAIAAAEAEGPAAAVIVHDVPLLAENGLGRGFDVVLVVDAPDDQRVRRLIDTRGMTAAHARDRISAQASREQRLAIADIVIDNSAGLDDLDHRVDEVWTVLRDRAAGAPSPSAPSSPGASSPSAPSSPGASSPGAPSPSALRAGRPGMSDPPPTVET